MSEMCFENLYAWSIILLVFFCHVTYLYWVKLLESQETPRSKQGRNGYSEFQNKIHLIQKTNSNHLAKLKKRKDWFVKIYMYDVSFKVPRLNPVVVA